MTCDITSFLTVFQSHPDDGQVIMCSGTRFMTEKNSASGRAQTQDR